ncbi:glycosyltransferase family 4 protein [Clostridium novyi]|uniref:Glycosyl transferase, group 1 family protein, putative n=1 Tax=Clostridium novyi (strain NT) TaxID=386415 RepID=A0PZ07_CLONN|nr:glycosyltransferase family 4 protein [Clostridium novyi]ABK60694.1 glycosyl transferase, group 1 family protein, putative [Clostridium novyi NT]KEH86126.1 hypothetical protein Z966_04220 [Clostridium novyi A str. NCTC 538]KEH87606.1 hypothetical protein Z967_03005 [Clostridium novyi A str. 4540]KEH94129.1 hypothetical protein Z964_01525 [Clostridium novyi A str. GD211209]
MKIVHVVEAFGGGVYSFLTELCNALCDKNGYEIVVVYSVREQTPKNFKKDFSKKVKFVHVDMCRGLNPYKNIRSLFKLKKVLDIENPDIIHLHSSKAGFLGRIASYMNRFNMNKVFYNPHGFSFLQQNESKFKRKVFLALEKYASRFGGSIVGCSKGEYEEALKIQENCININNGINTKKIDEILKSIDKKKGLKESITIGTIGRICYQKNPQQFNQIAEKFPKYNFVWIGDGELKNKLTSSNIQVTGWMERKKVIEKLLDLDIYIMTSLWEGLPISLLEAMYLEKPVIVSDVIGNRDVIESNENGYVCSGVDEFIKKIKILIEEDSKREEIGKSARQSICKFYNEKIMLQEYKKLYMSLESIGD